MKFNHLGLLLLFFSFIQCSNPSSTEANDASSNNKASSENLSETAIAKSFCSCAQNLIALNKKMESLHAEGKNDEFIKMTSQLGKEFKATVTCSKEALGAQKISETQQTSIGNALLTACPEIPERMVDQLTTQVSQ